MPEIQIKTLKSSPGTCATLSEMLVEAVTDGGSVSFMHPLPLEAANAFCATHLPRPIEASVSFSAPLTAKT